MPRRRRPPPPPPDDGPANTVIPPRVPEADQGFGPREAIEIKKILAAIARRRCESLRIYEPLPKLGEFHRRRVRVRLLRGSNRASKTLTAAVEFARAVTGQDPHGKYPAKDGVAFVFGLDGKHLGSTIYQKLFRAGAFKVIRDLDSGEWRTYRPWHDKGREAEAKPAPPLIPARFVKSVAWDDKKLRIPSLIVLSNGWELHFFSSLGQIPQGQAIDLWWIDEEVRNERLIEELIPRCADRKGIGFWSATPQIASVQFYNLHERADNADPDVLEIHAKVVDNPYVDDDEKEAMYRGWTEEQRRVRWDGDYAFSGFIIYPEFNTVVHAWSEAGWQVPEDWARYFAVDPGRQHCAVVFLAVPPPSLGRFAVAYHELYLERCDAAMFGKAVGDVSKGAVYEAGLIDSHAGKVTEMGSGRNVEEQYRQALVKNNVEFRHGTYFTWGADDVSGGILAVHEWLRVQPDGKPFLRVCMGRCQKLRWEAERYRYKPNPQTKLPTDVPNKVNDHLMDCLRYLALFGPVWRKPKPKKAVVNYAAKALKAKHKKKSEKEGGAGRVRLG